jgi:hypothetical protein
MDTHGSAGRSPSARTTVRRASATLVLILTCLACAQAQDGAAQQQAPREEGPPPLRYMPPDVRQRLEGAKDTKDRARLSMEIAEERLALAAQFAGQDRFEAATGEIGIYEAVVEDTVRSLHASGGAGRASNKLRDIFKRVEIRRVLPERHAVHFKDAIDFVRDRRDQALSAFYSDSVLREPRIPEMATPEGERATTSTAAQPAPDKKPDQKQQ